jgi:transcriptional regulator with XRE-family HTH domain
MSRFSRAYEAAIGLAGLTKAQAAAGAGVDASVLSRLLNDEREAQPEHVAALVRVLPTPEDREHCVREFLFDQCPPEFREQLVLHFGTVRAPRAQIEDQLTRNMRALEAEAVDNPDLRKLFGNLASLFGDAEDPPEKTDSPKFARRHPGQTLKPNPTAGQTLEELLPHAQAAITHASAERVHAPGGQ